VKRAVVKRAIKLSAAPKGQSITQGGTARYTVRVRWLRGFAAVLRGLPVGAALVPVLVLASSSAAVAYWAAAGAGAGQGTAQDAVAPVTITASIASPSLVPTGAPSGDVAATMANPNGFRVKVSLLSIDTSEGAAGFSSNASGCDLALSTQTNGGDGWTVPPHESIEVVLADALTMGTGAANACQGRTFTVYMVAS
jgi:hypothetical protein